MKRKSVFLAAAAIVLVLAVNLPLAWGYFSTYTEAKGGVRLQSRKVETVIWEKVEDWTKHVVIANSADGDPVYVRARAFGASEYRLTYESDGSWADGGDGFYYYNGILHAGEEAPELLVRINQRPAEPEEGQEFNVIVVYETTPVRYDKDGRPYADWNQKLQTGEGGAEG